MNAPGAARPVEVAGRRLLVTGSSGFIGSHMAARFAREGAVVAGLSRTVGRLSALAERGECRYIECDLEDAPRCRRVVGDFAPEIVLHFASRPDAPEALAHGRASVASNVLGTLNLIEACAGSARVLLYGDSCKVHGRAEPPYHEGTPVEPNSSYGATKAAAWWMCRSLADAMGFAAVSLRPTLIYGPGQGMNVIEHVAQKTLQGAAEVVLDGGNQTRDPLYIDDAVEACVRLVGRARELSGRSIPIGGGAEIAVVELAQRVVAACAGTTVVRACADRARATEMWRSWCDNRDAARLLGWSARVGLEDGLARTVESIRARLGLAPTAE